MMSLMRGERSRKRRKMENELDLVAGYAAGARQQRVFSGVTA
jgi:hypothetical protein